MILHAVTLVLGLFVVGIASGSSAHANDRAVKSVPVVELFTSQGCSSCPPADKMLGDLAGRDDLIALSFNVDYWDYLGWRDTLARPEFSARQRAYAAARGDGQVYTPQMVVNGSRHFVGGDRRALKRTLAAVARRQVAQPTVTLRKHQKLAQISIGRVEGWSGKATVWLAAIAPKVTTKIKRGENRGRKIAYHNVVRDMMPIGAWTGDELVMQFDPAMLMKSGAESCAIIIQE
ncbi:MAG: DUF1223 domain-containing protein, partial [Pseudomonadota bacterium]